LRCSALHSDAVPLWRESRSAKCACRKDIVGIGFAGNVLPIFTGKADAFMCPDSAFMGV
jgi:hypothetical protein